MRDVHSFHGILGRKVAYHLVEKVKLSTPRRPHGSTTAFLSYNPIKLINDLLQCHSQKTRPYLPYIDKLMLPSIHGALLINWRSRI